MTVLKKFYYDYDRLCSFDCLLNFVLAERGVGKTFGAIKAAIQDYLKHGNQFIYLRRYKTELEACVPKFFDAIIDAGLFQDHDFEVKGNVFYIDGKVAGYAIALSTSKILKSTSFPNVRTIIFDEFTITTGVYHYLAHEAEDLLDLIETVGRMRDNIRVWLLGNATTLWNPYFSYFDLSLPHDSEYKLFKEYEDNAGNKKHLIIVNYVRNEAYREAKKKTRFGRLVEGTKWGDYAINNDFLQDSNTFVRKRPSDAGFYFNLELEGKTLGIWLDDDAFMYVSEDYDPSSKLNFAFTQNDHSETTILYSRVDPIIKNIIKHYRDAHLVFESMAIKSMLTNCLLKYVN